MHCGGIGMGWRGRPSDSACRSSNTRRTPCMLMRSYSSVIVVSSAAARRSPAARNACSAIALSLPPLQQKSTSSGERASLMARRVFHADAKLAPKRRKAVHLRVLLVDEVVDAAVDAESARHVESCREIEQRVARIDDLAEKTVVIALAREISGEIPVHPQKACVERDGSGIHRPAEQAAARNVVRIEVERVARRGERPSRIVRVVRAPAQPARDARFAGKIRAARAGQVAVEK